MLDRDGGGSIDAEELYAVMKEMDIEISLEEIKDVLAGLDSDGNGEIDFDEFLYAMTETDRYLDSLADGSKNNLLSSDQKLSKAHALQSWDKSFFYNDGINSYKSCAAMRHSR